VGHSHTNIYISKPKLLDQLQVVIYKGDGTLVDLGDAKQADNEINRVYSATAANASIAGDKIIIKVSDNPGNITEAE
jgi:hypothetical protein